MFDPSIKVDISYRSIVVRLSWLSLWLGFGVSSGAFFAFCVQIILIILVKVAELPLFARSCPLATVRSTCTLPTCNSSYFPISILGEELWFCA